MGWAGDWNGNGEYGISDAGAGSTLAGRTQGWAVPGLPHVEGTTGQISCDITPWRPVTNPWERSVPSNERQRSDASGEGRGVVLQC